MEFASSIPEAPLTLQRMPALDSFDWRIPGSKIVSNRALVLAALAEGTSVLRGMLDSDDTRWVRRTLEALGIGFELPEPGTVVVHGGRSRLRPPREPLFVGNSASAIRFVSALAPLVEGSITLDGDASLRKRSLRDLVEGLRQFGVQLECAGDYPPITLHGRGGLPGARVRMRADHSSQFLSSMLLVAGLAQRDVELSVEGALVGGGYVDLTLRMVAAFGGQIETRASGYLIRAVGQYRACDYQVEADACSASCAFALAAGGQGRVRVAGLGEQALQSDARFVDILEQAGARVHRGEQETVVAGTGRLRALDVDMSGLPDCVPTLAALAQLADGITVLRNVGELRLKAYDRLAAIEHALTSLGQQVESTRDELRITPRPLQPATVLTHNDHQLAMSFAVLGALSGAVTIDRPRAVTKSYPDFWRDLAACYRTAGGSLSSAWNP